MLEEQITEIRLIYLLEKFAKQFNATAPYFLVIGSRACKCYYSSFRESADINKKDWDIIGYPSMFLSWFQKKNFRFKKIVFIHRKGAEEATFGITIQNYNPSFNSTDKLDIVVPLNASVWSARVIESSKTQPNKVHINHFQIENIICAPRWTLLAITEGMLYHSHQWLKSALDFRYLVRVIDKGSSPLENLWRLVRENSLKFREQTVQ
jgi:hypothetical protein